MATNYQGDHTRQRQRRKTLTDVRERLGDKLFAEFLIDTLASNGSTLAVNTLPAIVDVWLVGTAKVEINASAPESLADVISNPN